MTNNDLRLKWHDVQKELRKKYRELTDEDLNFEDGDYEALVNRLKARLQRSTKEVKSIIDNSLKKIK
jgi:hypothetical protein